MIERQHCHPLYMIERAVSVLYAIVIWVIVSIGNIGENMSEVTGFISSSLVYWIVGTCIILAVFALLIWLGWKNRWVSAENDTLIYESGIIFKKRISIPFSKINTIDMGRNVFQRIVGTCRLKLDTGALDAGNNGKNSSEMDLVFSLKDGEYIRSYILGRSSMDETLLRAVGDDTLTVQAEPKWLLKARFSDFLLYGLTSSSAWRLFWVIIAGVAFVAEISPAILEKIGNFIFPTVELAYNTLISYSILMIILAIIVTAVVISLACSLWTVLMSCLRFYNFRVAREGDNVVIRYGLISLKSYTMPVRNIHAITVHQNMLQQLLGRCSVELVSIGYGDEQSENSLLFPIIQLSKLDWLIKQILPEYSLDVSLNRPSKKSVRFLIVRPIFWSALFFGAIAAACSVIFENLVVTVVIFALAMMVIIVGSILDYKNTGIGWNNRAVVVSSGGLHKQVHYIRTDAVQSVSASSGVIQRKHGISTYRVDYHAPTLRSITIAKHLGKEFIEPLSRAIDI